MPRDNKSRPSLNSRFLWQTQHGGIHGKTPKSGLERMLEGRGYRRISETSQAGDPGSPRNNNYPGSPRQRDSMRKGTAPGHSNLNAAAAAAAAHHNVYQQWHLPRQISREVLQKAHRARGLEFARALSMPVSETSIPGWGEPKEQKNKEEQGGKESQAEFSGRKTLDNNEHPSASSAGNTAPDNNPTTGPATTWVRKRGSTM